MLNTTRNIHLRQDDLMRTSKPIKSNPTMTSIKAMAIRSMANREACPRDVRYAERHCIFTTELDGDCIDKFSLSGTLSRLSCLLTASTRSLIASSNEE